MDRLPGLDLGVVHHGVKLPATGMKIRVLEQNGTSVKVRFS